MKRKNNHRGDNRGKRIARAEFYLRVRAWMGEEAFKSARFLYLASFEGGDAAVLTAMGVPAKNQLAADFDGSALEKFREKYPDIPTFFGDVATAPENAFDCIFLDFCANISDRTLVTIQRSMRCLKRATGSVFAIAVQRARENSVWMPRFKAAAAKALEEQRIIHPDLDLLLEREGYNERCNDGRAYVLFNAAADAAEKREIALGTLTKMTYRGVDLEDLEAGKSGTPMLITAYVAFAEKRPAHLSKKRSRAERWSWFTRTHRGLIKNHVDSMQRAHIAWGASAAGRPYFAGVLDQRYARLARIGGVEVDWVGYEEDYTVAVLINVLDTERIDAALALNMPPDVVQNLRERWQKGDFVDQAVVAKSHMAAAVDNLEGTSLLDDGTEELVELTEERLDELVTWFKNAEKVASPEEIAALKAAIAPALIQALAGNIARSAKGSTLIEIIKRQPEETG